MQQQPLKFRIWELKQSVSTEPHSTPGIPSGWKPSSEITEKRLPPQQPFLTIVSSDDTISTEDTEIQTETLPRIAAGGTLERSVHLTAPDTPGTYYYGVCVNSVAAEADTTHNCSSATAITVKGADLMIFDAPQVSKNTVTSGETLSD